MARFDIPDSLWDAKGEFLRIPPHVASAYTQALHRHGLMSEAMASRPDDPPVGGLSLEQTNLHFAHAFDGSVARAQLALLDPYEQVPVTADAILRFLSGGTLCLVDVPCGAGAATMALLGTILEMRRHGVLPRVPLQVHVVGGEISGPACDYAAELFEEIKAPLEEQAITLTYELLHWDVLCPNSNSDLVERVVLKKHVALQTLVVVCNFNGFLQRGNKKKNAEPQLSELFRFASGATNGAIWLEPQTNAATKGLFPWLADLVMGKWNPFARPKAAGQQAEPTEVTQSSFEMPVKAPQTARVRLAVMPLDIIKN